MLTCFQAFHWFNLKPTIAEFSRILKPKGKIALVWKDRHVDSGDKFTYEHDRVITPTNNSPIHLRLNSKSYPQIAALFEEVYYSFSPRQALNRASLIGLAMSASYLPQTGVEYQLVIAALTNLHQKYSDRA